MDRSGNLLSQFNYANDALGRRRARNDTTNGTDWTSNVFGYNDRSELDTAVMGTNDFGYQYDAIGNRQVAIANIETNLYDSNVLNQYSAISNSLQAASSSLEYDPDGNLLSDGTWSYSWDAENRLIAVSNASTLVENAYDYMGRRVKKSVSQISDPSSVITNLFVYDGWNLIQETTGGATPSSRSYVWGLDLSGTLQGAGGVGGLLAIQDPESDTLTPTCDANGNVTDLIDTNGTSVAHYEYSPFGEIIAQAGTFASDNPFRFSSKYQDDETGFNYYGYRFYCPELGRWVNRDPIGEQGGLNLFAHTINNPISRVDPLGKEFLELVKSQTAEFVDIVLKAGDLTAEAQKEAQNAIADSLKIAKNSIQDLSATGGGSRFPPGLAGKLGQLSKPGDKITLPKSGIGKGALDLYSYLTWVRGGATDSFLDFEQAFKVFLADKGKTDGSAFASCLDVCIKATTFISDVPQPGLNIFAKFFELECESACCKHF